MSEIVDGVCRRLSGDKWPEVLACKFIDANMGCYLYVNPQGERRRTLRLARGYPRQAHACTAILLFVSLGGHLT